MKKTRGQKSRATAPPKAKVGQKMSPWTIVLYVFKCESFQKHAIQVRALKVVQQKLRWGKFGINRQVLL
jgi:hypothetical protein